MRAWKGIYCGKSSLDLVCVCGRKRAAWCVHRECKFLMCGSVRKEGSSFSFSLLVPSFMVVDRGEFSFRSDGKYRTSDSTTFSRNVHPPRWCVYVRVHTRFEKNGNQRSFTNAGSCSTTPRGRRLALLLFYLAPPRIPRRHTTDRFSFVQK